MRITAADVARFFTYVGPADPVTGCRRWLGGRSIGGARTGTVYGTFWLDGRSRRAHVVGAAIAGLIRPTGHQWDHTCGDGLCVEETHLEAVSNAVNQARRIARKRGLQPSRDAVRFSIETEGAHQ